MVGGIRTCLGLSNDPMFLWISSNSCPLNLLLARSHQVEIIIVKRLIQGCNNVTRARVEPRSFNLGRRKNNAFTIAATLPTIYVAMLINDTEHEYKRSNQNMLCLWSNIAKLLASIFRTTLNETLKPPDTLRQLKNYRYTYNFFLSTLF